MNTERTMSRSDCERFAEAIGALADTPDDAVDAARPDVSEPLDEHLAGCEPCRRLLADLRQIQVLAGTLEPMEPPPHLWRTVRQRVAADAPAPRARSGWRRSWWHYSLGGATATAAALVLAVVMTGERGVLPTAPGDTAGPGGPDVTQELDLVERHSIEALDDLAQLAGADQDSVAPVTAVLTRHLAMIDSAIADTRSALAAEPNSTVARARLQAGLQHKVALLQTTAATARHLSRETP